jgi:Transposase IS116/IS110/IS902 family
MVGPPLQPATTLGRVVPEPEIGTDRGHAGRSSQPCTHAAQAERGTGPIETVVSTRWTEWSPLVRDRSPPQAERARLPTKQSRVATRGAHMALIFADPTDGFTKHRQRRSVPSNRFRAIDRPPCSDLFGVKGRQWLAGLELPPEERESVDAAIRHVAFLDAEIAAVEKLIAQQALSWPEVRRLMTVPGVNLICAASFVAAVGDPNRFLTSRKLVAYLGLDPRVKQSGEGPARSGRISKRGSPMARWALVEAAWTAVLQPGPLHAFYERTKNRRGHGEAIVATARKLAVLFWCMLTRGEDYAHQQPSLTRKKLRRLEITAGARKNTRRAAGIWSTNDMMRDAERELAHQAEASYKRMVQDQQAGAPARKVGASATPERA